MDRSEILDVLKKLLEEKYEINPESLAPETRQDDIGLDSMTMVDLMLDIETELNFEFPDLRVPPNPSLNEIADLVSSALAEQRGT
jgi:acyl carrier protein